MAGESTAARFGGGGPSAPGSLAPMTEGSEDTPGAPMPGPTFSAAARRLFEEPRLGHVATIGSAGAPQLSAVWVDLDGDDVVFGTQRANVKVQNLRRDPRATVSVQGDPGGFLQPYVVASGDATIEEIGPAAWLERMDLLSERYAGGPFPMRAGGDAGVWVRLVVTKVIETAMG